jgi:peptide/nickel transport system ATP-binding protein
MRDLVQAGGQSPADIPTDVILRVQGLKKYFGTLRRGEPTRADTLRAVDDVSFSVKRTKTLALVGESGCGKTTTVRCIVRAIRPSSGNVWFRTVSGQVMDLTTLNDTGLRPLRTEIQMVFQDPYSSLNPRLTVLDIIAEPLVVSGIKNRTAIRERVANLLELVGLQPDHMTRFPNAFSGGQRQRIGIARALALHPSLIIADEAVSALDVSVRAQILNLLLELQDRYGISYLFVSHDLGVVKHISDQVGVMYVGQMVELADCEAIYHRPLHPYTAALLAAVPIPDPRRRRIVPTALGESASPRNPPPGCAFHPRCQHAITRCKLEQPRWTEVGSGRFVRCHRAHELQLKGIDL